MTEISLVQGDLTKQALDAIVNAANERMLGGGGVDGAIHRGAGPKLLERCREMPEVRPGVRCPTGEARVTDGCDLPARFVIHTVGPRYVMQNAPALLASAFRSSLELASGHAEIRTVGFPAISCGVFGYPIAEAAAIAIGEARREWDLDEVRFVLFGARDFAVFERALRS